MLILALDKNKIIKKKIEKCIYDLCFAEILKGKNMKKRKWPGTIWFGLHFEIRFLNYSTLELNPYECSPIHIIYI